MGFPHYQKLVMPGFMPGIHVLASGISWMAGTSPAMTENVEAARAD
jgi:hypothetical protein